MNSPDSLRLDDQLARMLKAYDQGIGDADGEAPTLNVSELPPELLRMLEADAAEARSEPAVSVAEPAIITSASPSHRVGRFELRRLLGRGGFGIVFLAFDPKLRREVALKIPRPEMLLSADARRRLFREALAAAGFDHPNLVPVYETGEIGPVCFIATGYCAGETLAHWLDRQAFPVPVRQAARLVSILAEAVQHAHERGVLHRDLKPNNVLLQVVKTDPAEQEPTPGSCVLRGERFLPRVVDFGLAKVAEQTSTDTGTRQIVGTPRYMAPEQAQARQDDIGPTADVYALGVILYEMLAGRAPYDGETDVEVLRQSIEGKLTPPRTLRSRIPRDLEAICLKAMARSPSKRYSTAVDLADDLRRFLTGLPTIARPLGQRARFMKWLRRNDQAVALGIVTSLALFFLVIGTWSGYESRRLKDDRDSVLQQQETIRKQDRDRMYAQAVRNAYLYWRAGDKEEMDGALVDARHFATAAVVTPCFAFDYLSHLSKVGAEPALQERPSPITAAAFADDGGQPIVSYADGSIEADRIVKGDHAYQIVRASSKQPPLGVEFSAGRITCRRTGEKSRVIFERTAEKGTSFLSVDLSDDGRRLAVGNDRGRISLWSLPAGTEDGSLNAEGDARIRMIAFGPEGQYIAIREVQQMYGTVGAFGLGPLFRLNGKPSQGPLVMKYLPVVERIAIAGQGSAIRVCEFNGNIRATLIGHSSEVTGLAPTPDGRVLASGSRTGEVKFWDLRTGQELFGMKTHTGPVTVLAFSADGRKLFTGGTSRDGRGEFMIWDAGTP